MRYMQTQGISVCGECYLIFNIISEYFVLCTTQSMFTILPFICIALKNEISLCMCIQLFTNSSL